MLVSTNINFQCWLCLWDCYNVLIVVYINIISWHKNSVYLFQKQQYWPRTNRCINLFLYLALLSSCEDKLFVVRGMCMHVVTMWWTDVAYCFLSDVSSRVSTCCIRSPIFFSNSSTRWPISSSGDDISQGNRLTLLWHWCTAPTGIAYRNTEGIGTATSIPASPVFNQIECSNI